MIHRAFWCQRFRRVDGTVAAWDDEQCKTVEAANHRLGAQYEALEAALPTAMSIDLFNSSEVFADESHQWGLSHFHYEPRYYSQALRELSDLVSASRSDT